MNGSTMRRPRMSRLAMLLCSAAIVPGLHAQQTGDGPEEILVTGSYIERPADRPQPVSVLDAAEIQANQRITLTEVVRDLPQISDANTTNNWQFPTNSIDLRGLGSRSTLILLNGQRMTIDANGGSQVDINNLAPTIMVERLELLLDGASALYGSDAVAGVANFITRDTFEGLEFNVSSQWADAQTDVPEIVVGSLFGVQGDDTGLVLGFELQRRDDKLQEEDVMSRERLEFGLKTALWNPGSFFDPDINPLTLPGGPLFRPTAPNGSPYGWRADPLCDSPLIGGEPGNAISDPAGYKQPGPDFCRGLLSLQRTSIPEQDLLTGMAVFTKDFGGDARLKIEANYARATAKSSFGTGVPLLALPSVSGTIPVLPATNPGVIDANQRNPNFRVTDYSQVFSRQLSPLDGDAASEDNYTKQNTYRLAATLDGVFGDSSWDWRVTGTFSQNDQESQGNDTITDRYARALQGYGGPACKWNFVEGAAIDPNVQPGEGPCQYWNPFASRLIAQPGDPTYNSPELLDWMSYGGTTLGRSRFNSFEWVTTSDLWEMGGGATGFAVGTQYRKQELEVWVDPISKDGGFGFSPQVLRNWQSDRDTTSAFAELVLFPSDGFEIDLAARYEETLDASSTEPKLSMLWTPTDNLYIRATAGSSFRIASETQLFGIGPGSVARPTIGGEVTQAVGIALGNDALLPEESDNWTLGFTWDITDDFTLELTYWNYDFTNQVTSTDANATLLADMADGWVNAGPGNSNPVPAALSPHPLFPGRPNEVCEITGRWAGPGSGQPLPAGCMTGFDIEIFRSSWINRDITETSGVDLTLGWNRTLARGGELGTRFIGSFVEKYAGIGADGVLVDVVGTDGFNVQGVDTNPDLRANVINTYRRGNHSFRTTWRYTSGTRRTDPNPLLAGFDEGSYTTVDVNYNYDLPTSNPSTLSFAVLNASDERPPLVPNGLITYNANLYDGRGRLFRLMYSMGF